jgi:radical SAM superfamily enzyme YgiQ (UPF0313 family)
MAKPERNLLLIAMSGVRVKDKQLLELGMTLPGFVERSKVIASLPSLSLLTVAAYTPENWQVTYREIDELSECDLACFKGFDLVGISAFTARILDAYDVADTLRQLGVTVVIGGLHASVLPDEVLKHADSVVVGEAELVWEELILDLEAGSLRKVYRSREAKSKFDLAHSRIPRYDLLDVEKYNRITLQTSRGCPLDCSFCAASRLISTYKVKPLKNIRQEIEAILSILSKPFIELADDNTFLNKKWSKELAVLFAEYPIKWFTETDISVADSDELLELLAQSGCAQLLIGFESSLPDSLRGLDAKNWKYHQYDSYLKKIEKIQSYGISVNGCFVIGFDSDDVDIFELTESFVVGSSLAEVQITLLTPFPGTDLQRRLESEGRLLEPVYWDKCTLFDVTYHPKQMTVDELSSGFRELMASLYSDERYRQRRLNFRQCLKSKRSTLQLESGGN